MGVIFDLLGSFIVRAAIVAIILNLLLSLHEALYRNTQKIYLNQVISAPSQTISYDLSLAGYNASKNFFKANTSEIIFYADLDNNGTSETVRYYLSGQILYRSINGGSTLELARSVSKFEISYYNIIGTKLIQPIPTPASNIKSVRVVLTIVSDNTITTINSGTLDNIAQSVTWSKHFFPANL